jgi:hypothetical protein
MPRQVSRASKRVLIVLDNARNAAQVRPLLPGDGNCPVLITSQNAMTGLAAAEGAQLLSLDVLPLPDACELLTGRLGEDRMRTEPRAAADLVRLCGGLPRALVVAAAQVAFRPEIRLETLTAELRRRRQRRPVPRPRALSPQGEWGHPAALPGA